MHLETLIPSAKRLAQAGRAINHPLRQKLLHYLALHPGSTVTDIYRSHNLEQSVASQQLAILRTAGIVKAERKGKNMLYSLNEEKLQQIERVGEELEN